MQESYELNSRDNTRKYKKSI